LFVYWGFTGKMRGILASPPFSDEDYVYN